MSLGQNWQKVLRLVPKQKNQKMHFEITMKMLRISQDPWAACKTWSSNEFFSAAVLKQRKKASVKNPNTEAGPVPFALFWSEF
jgi:hypothetical protein